MAISISLAKPRALLDQEALVASLEASVARERAKLEGMQEMFGWANASVLRSRGAGIPGATVSMAEATKGRQKGAIAKRWRRILWALDGLGGNFTPADVSAQIFELEGRLSRPAESKRQMDAYIDLGYVMAADGGAYNVTDEFRAKFPFAELDDPSPDFEEGSSE